MDFIIGLALVGILLCVAVWLGSIILTLVGVLIAGIIGAICWLWDKFTN
jgi:hypothetical protein